MSQFPYKILKNDIYGRYIVANKKIKQGELILKEKPILIGSQLDGPLACFSCFKNVSTEGHIFCTKCKTAILCSPKCNGKFHPNEECVSLKECEINGNILVDYDQAIFALRCLLLRKYKPDIFQKACQLESHLADRKDKLIYRRHKIQVEQILHKLNILDPTDINDELVQKVCGILDVNTFEIRPPNNVPVTNPEKQCLRGLYLQAALMAHNCRGNTHIAVDNDFVMTIYASIDINENAPIFFNYTNVLQGTVDRRQHLREGKYFECHCERCKDPTEFGTDVSSLKCYKCKLGIIKPPALGKVEMVWRCNKCMKEFESQLIHMILNEGKRLIEVTDYTNFQSQESLLKKLLGTFHCNHYLVLEVIQNLVALYNRLPRNISNLNRKIELCTQLSNVFIRLEPGISRIRAITMYELQSAMVDLAHKQFKDKDINNEQLLDRLNSAQVILKEAVRFLLYEPANSPEGHIAKVAMSELKMLQQTLQNTKSDISRTQRTMTEVEQQKPPLCDLKTQSLGETKKIQEGKSRRKKKRSAVHS